MLKPRSIFFLPQKIESSFSDLLSQIYHILLSLYIPHMIYPIIFICPTYNIIIKVILSLCYVIHEKPYIASGINTRGPTVIIRSSSFHKNFEGKSSVQ